MIIATSLGDRAKWRDQLYRANISSSAKAVGAYISDRIQQETGKGVAKLRTIAAVLRISLSTAKRTIKEMVRAGLLIVESGVGWRANRYQCVLNHCEPTSDTTVSPSVTPPCNPGIDTTNSPLPPKGQESIQFDLEINDTLPGEPKTSPKQLSLQTKLLETENTAEAQPEPEAHEITEQDLIQAIIAHFLTTTGTRCDQARHRRAILKALKTHTPEQIKRAATYCAENWSNRTWATPAAVCKPGRIDEVLSQAKATAAPRAACHVPFKREKPETRCAPEVARAGLASLKAALRF